MHSTAGCADIYHQRGADFRVGAIRAPRGASLSPNIHNRFVFNDLRVIGAFEPLATGRSGWHVTEKLVRRAANVKAAPPNIKRARMHAHVYERPSTVATWLALCTTVYI